MKNWFGLQEQKKVKMMKPFQFFVAIAIFQIFTACQSGTSDPKKSAAAPTSNFEIPAPRVSNFKTNPAHNLQQHIESLWPVLMPNLPADATFLPVPRPFLVSSGQATEFYYFDSYFTMLGWQAAGRRDLVENMVENFAHLIDKYGHVPSGNRSYFLGRSQPPFFSLMVKMLDEMTPKTGTAPPLVRYFLQMEKEYAFWMSGWADLKEDFTAKNRVVRVQEGYFMNRYFDETATSRPEAKVFDEKIAAGNPSRPAAEIYQNLRAAGESGWNLSSRWCAEGANLGTVQTADLLPVDLNCLMWHLELTLSEAATAAGEPKKAQRYGLLAFDRRRIMRTMFFEKSSNWYQDFNWHDRNLTGNPTLAGMFPLFFDFPDKLEADAVAKTLETKFLRPGGLVCTLQKTGQNWDAPFGFAPLIWVSIEGLRKAGHEKLATEIKKRWLENCTNVFKRTGKILEKYDVENLQTASGGGNYAGQDGFGWTNGVLLKLILEK